MNRKILGFFVVTLLIATAVLPVLGTMNENEPLFIHESYDLYITDQKHFASIKNQGSVLWDNGMHYHNAAISQWDPTDSFHAIGADDFQFEETTVVTDVHWMSLYAGYDDFDFDWNVSFYMDRGDGMAPGVKIYEQVFPNAVVHETFIEEIPKWDSWMFSYWVDLPDAITFTGGEKYWISIQGIGTPFAKSYWGSHAPIVLHEFVWKSLFFGQPDWTDSSEKFDISRDWCFQLTGDGEPVVPDLDCDGTLSWTDVEPGAIVNSNFTVINNGDFGSMLGWEVLSYPNWGTNWSAKWYYLDELIMTNSGFVGKTNHEEIFVEVQVPNEKNQEFSGEIVIINIDNPEDTCTVNVVCKTPRSKHMGQFQSLIERFIERFPILKLLI